MSPATTAPPDDELVGFGLSAVRRSTRDRHKQCLAAGFFAGGVPIELVKGDVLEKEVQKPPHETTLRRLTNRSPRHIPTDGWCGQIQGAISLPTDNEPEPDRDVLRGADSEKLFQKRGFTPSFPGDFGAFGTVSDFDGRFPGGTDVALVIEASDSTQSIARRIRGRAYARAGITGYWLINVADRLFEGYTDPDPAATPLAYRTRTDFRPGQDVSVVPDGQTVATTPAAALLS